MSSETLWDVQASDRDWPGNVTCEEKLENGYGNSAYESRVLHHNIL